MMFTSILFFLNAMIAAAKWLSARKAGSTCTVRACLSPRSESRKSTLPDSR